MCIRQKNKRKHKLWYAVMQSKRELAVVCCMLHRMRTEKAQAVVCYDAVLALALDLLCSGGAHLEVVDHVNLVAEL